MKKMMVLFAILSLFLCTSVALSQEETTAVEGEEVVVEQEEVASDKKGSEFYAGLFLGGAFAEDLDMTDNKDPRVDLRDLDLDPGLTAGVKLGCRIGGALRKAVALELEYNHITNTDAKSQLGFRSGGRNIDISGEIPIHSVFLNFIIRHPLGKLHPYIGVGPGWSWFKFSHIQQSANVDGFAIYGESKNATDNTFSISALLGLEFDIADRASFVLGYKYFHVEPKLDDPGVDLIYKAHLFSCGFNFNC